VKALEELVKDTEDKFTSVFSFFVHLNLEAFGLGPSAFFRAGLCGVYYSLCSC
jgi:hypothetical protein